MREQKKADAPETRKAEVVPMDDAEAAGIVGGTGGDPDTNEDGSFESRLPDGTVIIKGPGAGE